MKKEVIMDGLSLDWRLLIREVQPITHEGEWNLEIRHMFCLPEDMITTSSRQRL